MINLTPPGLLETETFTFQEDLFYFDGPLIFSTKSNNNQLYIFHWIDLINDTSNGFDEIYLVYQISDQDYEFLINNKLYIYDVIKNSPNLYKVTIKSWINTLITLETCHKTSFSNLEAESPNSLPDKNIFIFPTPETESK